MNKTIYIWDAEYNSGIGKFYNYKSMKISAYHKQLGDEVSLCNLEFMPQYCDKIYLIKEDYNSLMPPLEVLDNPKLVALGNAMKGFPSYIELPYAAAMCRPDYLLFPQKINHIKNREKTQFIQLTQGLKILPLTAGYKNSFSGKKLNLIVDNIWNFSDSTIIELLDQILQIQNVGFKEKIKLKPILTNSEIKEKFLKLDFCKSYKNSFINDYGNDVNKIKEIIDFISIADQNRFTPIKIQSITLDHKIENNGRLDLFRDLEIFDYAKKNKVRISFTLPKYHNSPFVHYFIELKYMSNHCYQMSYIEYLLQYTKKREGKTEEEILGSRLNWYSYYTAELVYLIKNYYEIISPWIYTQWGNSKLNINIDLDYIRKEA